MITSSESGMRDLALGGVVLVSFSAIVYLLVIKFSLIWENLFLIGIGVFIFSFVTILLLFGSDLIVALLDYLKIVKDSEDYTIKDPEIP